MLIDDNRCICRASPKSARRPRRERAREGEAPPPPGRLKFATRSGDDDFGRAEKLGKSFRFDVADYFRRYQQ